MDGKELLSSSLDHKARFISFTSLTFLFFFESTLSLIFCFIYGRIHDLGTLEMTKEFSGHSDSVNCAIYFSTDRILTASQDCTVKVS